MELGEFSACPSLLNVTVDSLSLYLSLPTGISNIREVRRLRGMFSGKRGMAKVQST